MRLHAALPWLVEDARQRLRLEVELHIKAVENTRCKQPSLYETALFRIAHESLTNVARHAHAQHVCILLTQEQDGICLQVRDDGCGFDPSQQRSGLGIFGMRERASLLGGTLQVQSQPGQGTTVQASLPLPTKNEAAYD